MIDLFLIYSSEVNNSRHNTKLATYTEGSSDIAGTDVSTPVGLLAEIFYRLIWGHTIDKKYHNIVPFLIKF